MTYKQKALIYTVFLLSTTSSFAQNTANSATVFHQDHSAVLYVYGQEWLNANPAPAAAIEECLNQRISYLQQPLTADEKFPLLSSFSLMNKFNAEITAIDYANFAPDSFKPLTYSLPFFSDMKQVIRVDGSDYLIVIEPLNRK